MIITLILMIILKPQQAAAPARSMALNGTHLLVAAAEWVPFVTFQDHQDGSFTTSGLLMDFMEIFARKLNFT